MTIPQGSSNNDSKDNDKSSGTTAMMTDVIDDDKSAVTSSRDPRMNLLAAYEGRRRRRVHQLNVLLYSQAKDAAAAGKHDDDDDSGISNCHDDDTAMDFMSDDTVNGNDDAMLRLHLAICSSCSIGCHYGPASSTAGAICPLPEPDLESHPDDIFFKSFRNISDYDLFHCGRSSYP